MIKENIPLGQELENLWNYPLKYHERKQQDIQSRHKVTNPRIILAGPDINNAS